jgi:hypothetical protein
MANQYTSYPYLDILKTGSPIISSKRIAEAIPLIKENEINEYYFIGL